MAEPTSHPVAEIHAARMLMLAGWPRDALRSMAALQMPYATLALVRGECCYVLGEWADAVRFFEDALRLAPNSPRAELLLMLAREMLDLGKLMRPGTRMESQKELLKAVEEFKSQSSATEQLESTDEIGLVSETLAELMIRQGKFEEARKVFIQLSRLNPDRYEYFRERIHAVERSHIEPSPNSE